MNFTVDDADPSFSYSNGWAVQSDSDADRDEFFQSTYHVATVDGASMSFQFQGSAFTLYGSRGPGHVRSLPSPPDRYPRNEANRIA